MEGEEGRERGGGIGPPTGLPKITNIFSVERRSILAHDRMLQNARLSFLSRINTLPALAHASFERDTYLSCSFALGGSQRSGWISVTRDLNALARDRILQTTRLSILRRVVHSRKLGQVGRFREIEFHRNGSGYSSGPRGRECDLDNVVHWRVFGTTVRCA